jgi:selenocysteine lyase/cysteine desulfurase
MWVGISLVELFDLHRKSNIAEKLFDGIEALGSTIFSPRKKEIQIGVISFLIKGMDPDHLIQELESKYKIIIRAGSPSSQSPQATHTSPVALPGCAYAV